MSLQAGVTWSIPRRPSTAQSWFWATPYVGKRFGAGPDRLRRAPRTLSSTRCAAAH